ncbi:branched-chain amino acid ABC transporter permease [Floricoccus penangensis]|uniref:Branched-chain amino acid ABC transporter permease n=1 Tax=Floricoccus penangensis TaxID=1859475 RepID=A0A9Q5NZL8_9LACT|nr:branched-chain amino acid ABC transporter permease [Floricoccus penangensis]OFI45932.1 branched-chain amino acid ABC transporter permease [Floricoccus penangensis]
MKKNFKINLTWLALIVAGYLLLSLLIGGGVINPFGVQTISYIGIQIILAVALNFIMGISGQFSFGTAGFMAVGAYAAAIVGMYSRYYVHFYLAMFAGAVVAGLLALIVGIPTLRLKGDYLAIATLGVSEIIRILIMNGGELTNGAAGLSGIPRFTNWQTVYIFVVLAVVFTMNFINSTAGRETLSIREDEIAAESMGVNTTKVKVIAFVYGAVLSSIAGSLYAGLIGTVTPKDFTWLQSVNIIIIVVFGGLGSITGTIIAAIALGFLNVFLQDFGSLRMIIYSLALIMVMIFRPGGLLGTKEFKLSTLFNKKTKEGR